MHFSNSVINVLISAWIGLKWRKDEVHSVCWGVCDQSLEWIKARSSLRSKRSVITLLWIHSGFYIPTHGETAPCSLHLNGIRDYWEKRNMWESCSTLLMFCGTPKIIPTSAKNIVTRIIHSRVLSREHRAELEFRRGIAAINNNYTHSHRFRQNASHLRVLLILELTHALLISVRPQIAIRRPLLIIIRGVCKCDILI